MIAELGTLTIAIALTLAVLLATLPALATVGVVKSGLPVARTLAAGLFVYSALAFGLLGWLLLTSDFSVDYVARHSNLGLPWYYRLCATWGGHEGSLLLWLLILSGWTFVVALQRLPAEFQLRALAVLGMVSTGFVGFILFSSNPFARLSPIPSDGADLNPLLQDFGLIIHPPLLYLGYVGTSVPFAFVVAALWLGRLDAELARLCRPHTLVSFAFLTLGIALGSWWAYYELGWGGWWFWDPVENASFMPWLVGVALLHSQAVTEKRGALRSSTVLLAIAGFALCLLGTFLVRSGVLTSVHAFASDPSRGLYLLLYFAVVVGAALLLFAWRAPSLGASPDLRPQSREGFLIANNLFMAGSAAMVLLGTLYPLIAEALGMGMVSVGAPYFTLMFIILMAPLMLLMAIAPFIRWREDVLLSTLRRLAPLATVAIGVGLGGMVAAALTPMQALYLAGAVWIAGSTLVYLLQRVRRSGGLVRIGGSSAGLVCAHLGVAVFLVGVGFADNPLLQRDVALRPGESTELAGLRFKMERLETVRGPNYSADRAQFTIWRGDQPVAALYPEKRRYDSNRANVMTEAGIDAGLTRDFFVALGEPLENGAWAVRIYIKPYIRWIWSGALLIALGGLWAALDRRYRLAVSTPSSASASAEGPNAALAGA